MPRLTLLPKIPPKLWSVRFFLNGFTVSGECNLCLFFAGENIVSLESIIDTHLRNDIDVEKAEFNIVTSIAKDFIFPYKLEVNAYNHYHVK